MTVKVKICGLSDANSVAALASVPGRVRYAGFVFYPKSPRAVSAQKAAELIALLPDGIAPVGLFVDPSDDDIAQVLAVAPLQILQLHGRETPQHVADIKKRTGLSVIKAIGIATAQDVAVAHSYESVADLLLLDAMPAPDSASPGGNAKAFDWGLLKKAVFSRPWMLAGGLTADNVAEAVAITGAQLVDVSSGVEDAPGHKNTQKIQAFLQIIARLETCC